MKLIDELAVSGVAFERAGNLEAALLCNAARLRLSAPPGAPPAAPAGVTVAEALAAALKAGGTRVGDGVHLKPEMAQSFEKWLLSRGLMQGAGYDYNVAGAQGAMGPGWVFTFKAKPGAAGYFSAAADSIVLPPGTIVMLHGAQEVACVMERGAGVVRLSNGLELADQQLQQLADEGQLSILSPEGTEAMEAILDLADALDVEPEGQLPAAPHGPADLAAVAEVTRAALAEAVVAELSGELSREAADFFNQAVEAPVLKLPERPTIALPARLKKLVDPRLDDYHVERDEQGGYCVCSYNPDDVQLSSILQDAENQGIAAQRGPAVGGWQTIEFPGGDYGDDQAVPALVVETPERAEEPVEARVRRADGYSFTDPPTVEHADGPEVPEAEPAPAADQQTGAPPEAARPSQRGDDASQIYYRRPDGAIFRLPLVVIQRALEQGYHQDLKRLLGGVVEAHCWLPAFRRAVADADACKVGDTVVWALTPTSTQKKGVVKELKRGGSGVWYILKGNVSIGADNILAVNGTPTALGERVKQRGLPLLAGPPDPSVPAGPRNVAVATAPREAAQQTVEVRGVLAGRYRGRDLEPRMVTHAVLVTNDRDAAKTLCGRESETLVDTYGAEPAGTAPTCPRCLPKWQALAPGIKRAQAPAASIPPDAQQAIPALKRIVDRLSKGRTSMALLMVYMLVKKIADGGNEADLLPQAKQAFQSLDQATQRLIPAPILRYLG